MVYLLTLGHKWRDKQTPFF